MSPEEKLLERLETETFHIVAIKGETTNTVPYVLVRNQRNSSRGNKNLRMDSVVVNVPVETLVVKRLNGVNTTTENPRGDIKAFLRQYPGQTLVIPNIKHQRYVGETTATINADPEGPLLLESSYQDLDELVEQQSKNTVAQKLQAFIDQHSKQLEGENFPVDVVVSKLGGFTIQYSLYGNIGLFETSDEAWKHVAQWLKENKQQAA